MQATADVEMQLSVLNPQPQRLPGPGLLHHLLFGAETGPVNSEYVVSRRSETAAVPALDYQSPDGRRTVLSYSQLHQKAQLLASEISQRQLKASEALASVRSGDAGSSFSAKSQYDSSGSVPLKDLVVPVLVPQAPELYLSLLAILKAGGAFCPIQLDAPADRIRFILCDVSATVVLTTQEMASKLPSDLAIEVVLVDQIHLLDDLDLPHDTTQLALTDAPPTRIPTEVDLAYVMYTSGSTGTPKGVGVPHIAATQSLLSHDRHIPPFERFLQFAAPTFDVSVFEIFFPLFRGATLVSCSRAEMLSDLPAVIRSMNVDACELTPTVAGSLLRSRKNAPCLRLMLTIGEMLTEPVVREFGASAGHPSILWAMYGPTEAAIHCTLQPALDGAASVKNIGFPLDTVSAYVLEMPSGDQPAGPKDPKIVPLGDVGELAVGGYQLARGYINRPEQTAAAFIDTEKFGRLYRTSDKARITDEGILECSGRLSGGQVKLRGQRIELGEIEQAALRANGCLGSAAAVINGNLVAFCDAGPNEEADMKQRVLESCKSWLPRFMIPGDIVIMSEFPRLASGKVDRRRLVDQYADSLRSAAASQSLSPTVFKDDLDRQLHEIARDILGCEIESNFPLAAAGVDSLRSIRFAASIRSAGFHNVSAVDVLEAKTLSTLRARIQRLKDDAAETSDDVDIHTAQELDADTILSAAPVLEGISRDSIEFISECTPVQAAMLGETLADPQAYCNWIELGFAGRHDADEIASCFHRLIEANEALRTGFIHFDGRFSQVVWKQASPTQIQKVDFSTRDYVWGTEQSFLMGFRVEVFETESCDTDMTVRAVLHIHHAVYDGWSADLIRADLETMLGGGDIAARPPYSRVVQHYLSISTDATDAAKQFWAQLLNGHQPSPFPELRTRTDEPTAILSLESLLPSVDSDAVESISRKLECGTQAIFQAALTWLWGSLIGSSDVVIGTVASGRTLPVDGIEDTIGTCLQTVPLRADLSQMRTIHDLLSTIQSTNRALLPHAFLPLAEIKKTAELLLGQPLYDVLFVYQESLYSQRTSRDLVSEVAHKDYLETKLLWEIEPREGKFHIRATFHGDVFPKEQIDVMMAQYLCIVRHLANNVDKELTSIRSCFPQDLLSCYNIDYKTFNGCADLAHVFQKTARQYPNRPAVCFASSIGEDGIEFQTISYRELDGLSNRIARYLRSNGAAPGNIVSIILEKSILLYAGMIGILKAGCTYVPLLPSIPSARARTIMEQAGIQFCLTNRLAAATLVGLPVTPLDLQSTDLDKFSDSAVEGVPVEPSSLAYIMYTSGSTGVPKGVCVTHFNISSHLDVLTRIYPLRPDGRLLQSCSQAFDVSAFEIFFTWKTGMCLCSAVNDVLFDDLERAIRLLNVTHLSMTPTVASLVNPKNTPSVEFLVVAGEPLLESVFNMWWPTGIHVGYGPSETTNILTVKHMTSQNDVTSQLGFSFENTSTFVLHFDSLEPVSKGALGEFCFGGDQVAAGYLQLPTMTAEKFIDHPFYGRIYRSGDVGRMRPDGSLLIIGRIDDQIKLRGQRIELNEINSILQESGLVSEPITLLLRHGDSNPELLASFFTPSKRDSLGSTLSTSHVTDLSNESSSFMIRQLFSLLQSRLPAYMVPTHLIPISSIPLTPAGKTDKRALKELFQALPLELLSSTSNSGGNIDGGDKNGGQWSELEKQIARIISEALKVGVQSIGRWTPLPSLGLDSISAIRLSKLVQQSLQRRLPISVILKNATVARLSQALRDESPKIDAPSLYSLDLFSANFLSELRQTLDSRGLVCGKVLPCTPLQEGMLVSPARNQSYINRMLFKLSVRPEKLQSAWMRISEREEILRTCFVTTDSPSHPISQVILEGWKSSWIEYDTQDSDSQGTATSIENVIDRHVQSLADPVDSYQPPVSFAVISQSDGCFLSFVCHHAIYDGEAMEKLLFEVEQTVKGKPLPPTVPTFDSFLSQALSLPSSTEDFWKNHLNDFRPILLRNESSISIRESKVSASILEMPLSGVQERAHNLGFSLLTTLQSVWTCVLSLLGEEDDVCFGNVYNGRSLPLGGSDELVAPCFNTLPVRVQLSTLRTVKDLMSYFQALNPDMMKHQFTPLRHIQRKYAGGSGRLFDSLLLLQQPSRPLDSIVWTLERDDGEMDDRLLFNLSKWRLDAAQAAINNMQVPPWQIVIVEDLNGTGVTCHLAIHHGLYDAASLSSILDNVSRYASGLPLKRAPQTETAVSEILHQITSSTSSDISEMWKKLATRAVINTFPVLTPLKAKSPLVKVAVSQSSKSFTEIFGAAMNSGFTVHAVLQAAWTRILSSYIGDSGVVFGTVLSGRNSEATSDAVFPCLTTLPVVAENHACNRQLVEQLMSSNILLQKTQHVPLSQIQKWLGRADSRLFDTLLVYQNIDRNGEAGQVHLPWKIIDEEAHVDYPISLEATPQTDGPMQYQLTFDASVIPVEQVELLLRQFDATVCHLAFHPDNNEDDLIATEPTIFSALPARDTELESEIKLMHQFVEHQARKIPHKTALQFVTAFDGAGNPVSKEWTYAELNHRGNAVASIVSQHSVPGSIVSICFDKCPEAFFAILGILKAGCSFVALDPEAPSTRKEFILQDSKAVLLLTDTLRACQPSSTTGLFDSAVGVAIIGLDESSLASQHAGDLDIQFSTSREILPNDNCYCLYTSGTTGTPKGCAITHENAVQAMLAFQELFRSHYDETSRWLQFASFHFDVSVLEQYWTWSVGVVLVGAPRDLILEDLAGTISRLCITHIDLTPSLGRLLDPSDVPTLCRGVFITGGEPLKQEMLDSWGPTGAVHNFYGPTEATIGVTSYPQVPQNGRASNIGRQFPNVGSFVFRPGTQTPVLRGAVGELCVSGKLVGKGYLNREDLTSERFPTLSEEAYPGYGERVYRTGDLVRLLYDGCYDFLGRADDQVKLRGQRLEIGEINHAIRLGVGNSIGDVATLVIRDDVNKKDFLVSFVVISDTSLASSAVSRKGLSLVPIPGDTAAALSRQVQAACRERLPGYMVPTYVVQLPFIPLSANNKAEAKELRRLFNSLTPEDRMKTTGAGHAGDQIDTLSGSPGQELLYVLRQLSLLDKDEGLAPNTSIFELGIDSISVLRFARALKKIGLPAAPALLLSHPIIGDLVIALKTQKTAADLGPLLEARLLVEACQHRNRSHVCNALGISPDDIEYIAPCSALQQGMVSRSRSGQETTQAYFNTFTFKLAEDVSIERLMEAWKVVVRRNSILRTRFVVTNEGVVQAALKFADVPWTQVSLDGGKDIAEALEEYTAVWVSSNDGDVIRSPLEFLVGERQGDRCFVMHIFHGLYDAISLDRILDQVFADYEGMMGDDGQDGGTSFLDALIHGPLRSYGNSRPFWETHLRESFFKPLSSSASSAESLLDITAKRSIPFDSINSLCSSLGVTHAALIQALWVAVLQETYGDGTTLGLVLSGRTIFDLDGVEGVIGPLFNTLPFYMPRRKNETWASLAKECHAFNTAILPFQQVPLRDVQKWCSSGQPLFDILLSFQFGGASSSAQKIWTEVDSSTQADYPLALEVILDGATDGTSNVEFLLVARAGAFEEATVHQIVDRLVLAVDTMSRNTEDLIFAAESEDCAIAEEASDIVNFADSGNSLECVAKKTPAHLSLFEWEGDATKIRQELSLLSGTTIDSIHEETTLLELGLDSVDTIKLSARLRALGIHLSNSQLIRGQCISELVKVIATTAGKTGENDTDGKADKSLILLNSVSASLREYLALSGRDLSFVEDVLPPTPLQEGLIADMIQSGFTRYFNHDILELEPGVDSDRLKNAWMSVVRASPILRTVFYAVDSLEIDVSYCQVVKRDIDIEDLITDCEASGQDDLIGLVEAVRERAMKSEGESGLLHLTFVHIPVEQRRYLVLSISHSLYDGWSLDLMHRRVESAYRNPAGDTGHPDTRSPYLQQLGNILNSSGPQSESFWRSFLSNAQPTHVKASTESQEQTGGGKAVTRIETASSVSAAGLLSFCRKEATSVQVVGQACWAAVLATLTGSLDVVFGVVLSGRETEGADELLFPTMNTVPVRVILHGTTAELLQYMQSNMGSISENQHFPLRKAQRMVAKSEFVGEYGAFNTLFIFQKRTPRQPSSFEEDNQPLMHSIEGFSDVEYPICVEMEVVSFAGSESIIWRMACDSSYASSSDASRIVHELDTALRFLVQSSSSPAHQDSILRFEEKGVSLCGLPTFTPLLAKEVGSQRKQTSPVELSNNSWSLVEEAIRSTLSVVSGVPSETIKRRGQTLYHLGLDSISAIKVSSLLRKTHGLSLGVREMLASESVQDMAAFVTAKQSYATPNDDEKQITASISTILDSVQADAVICAAGISNDEIQQVLPATAMQVHMVSVWQTSNGEVFFPEFHYSLSGVSGGREAVFAAWEALVAEVPLLRTVLLATASSTVPILQVILKPASGVRSSVSEEVWPAVARHKPLAFLTATSATESDRFVLALRIHHALYDAVSLQTILDRFQRLCSSEATDVMPLVSEKTDTFGSWTWMIARQMSETSKRLQQEFWTRYFCSAAKDAPKRVSVSTEAPLGRVSLYKEAVLSNITVLRTVASTHGLSLQSLLFAAYAKALCMDKRKKDVIFGIYLANRENEVEESGRLNKLLQYPTLCLVPLLISSPTQRSMVDLAQQIQRDIHAISSPLAPSSPAPATSGLWEIRDWAGIEVDSFVNFLLPDQDMETKSAGGRSASLELVKSSGDISAMPVSDTISFKPDSYDGLGGNTVKYVYKDAIDLEMAVRGDRLDMGVFGSHTKLGDDGAGELMAKVIFYLLESSV
ncbi:nonribosomal siderophore peptide synthetase [Grosmannia clavigera kw1407]|uniref:Nonribosomal siderophore peptide synthetase n=1 Tax=Grosmannia clavigera (strain kw1407 / UAMH 11150) TaxID=655863 RepID=F0X9P1_GROCL|nr:nonribosomal siderophore peptide synthetase [Grosmannia clavigera kw1407]EFX05497.1 nonribosomal siderophore peptide synthetase [Grosmannia clavigera kw1407]